MNRSVLAALLAYIDSLDANATHVSDRLAFVLERLSPADDVLFERSMVELDASEEDPDPEGAKLLQCARWKTPLDDVGLAMAKAAEVVHESVGAPAPDPLQVLAAEVARLEAVAMGAMMGAMMGAVIGQLDLSLEQAFTRLRVETTEVHDGVTRHRVFDRATNAYVGPTVDRWIEDGRTIHVGFNYAANPPPEAA